MKKILSLILVLAMTLSLSLVFTSCFGGDELSVDGVKENVKDTIISATEKTNDYFLGDDEALSGILNVPASDINGAQIYFDGKTFGLPALTLTAAGTEDKSSMELLIGMGDQNYTANVYQNSTGIALFGPSLFGVQSALLVDPENFMDDFFSSDLAKMLGISEDMFDAPEMNSTVSSLLPLLAEFDFAGIIEKIQNSVTPAVSAIDYNGTACILITYTINNETIKSVIDIIATEISQKLTDYADMINQAVTELKTQLDSTATFTASFNIAVKAADSIVAYDSFNLDVTVSGEAVSLDITTTYAENEIKTVADVTADGKTATGTLTLAQKIADGKSTYTCTLTATAEGKTETVATASFEYTANNGAYVFTFAVPMQQSLTVNGTLANTENDVTFAISSIKYGVYAFDVTASIKLLKNAEVKEMPEGAKNITEITEAEWAEIMGEFTESPLFAIISEMMPKEDTPLVGA